MTNRESLPVLAAIEVMERPLRFCTVVPTRRCFCSKDGQCSSPRPVVAALLRDIAAGIRVLNTMNGYRIPEELIQERANNLVTALVGNYRIEEETS